jgi:murein DD-endopeptidase MepM/ murein hydrolase activator NlpD
MIRRALVASLLALLWLSRQHAQPALQGPQDAISGTIAAEATHAARAEIVPDWRAHINAGFDTVDCGAWGFQSGCQHFGVDVGGDGEGTPVYAPVGGWYRGCQDNGESGPYIGKWITYDADDGAAFLINHFRDSPFCGVPAGTRIEAGALLGTMRGDANHVHVQTSVNGQLVDFEAYMQER